MSAMGKHCFEFLGVADKPAKFEELINLDVDADRTNIAQIITFLQTGIPVEFDEV